MLILKYGHQCGSALYEKPSRRELITGAAAGMLAAAVQMPQALAAAYLPKYRVDVHYHHIAPAWINNEQIKKSMAPEVAERARAWTPAQALEEMDRNSIATAICSVANPGVWFGDIRQARRLARTCNDYGAGMARDHKGRFGLFAALPLPDTEGSLAEIAYAFDVLKAEGIGLFTSYGDAWLADPKFAPVFEELNRRKAVVYVHPVAPSCCRQLVPGIPAALLEYPIDTSRTILAWVLARAAYRYPDLRLIFSHAGGLVMSGIGRLQILAETQPSMKLPASFPDEIAKFYYEISSSADSVTMRALRSYVPVSNILLGTDSPFINSMTPNLDRLQKLALSPSDLASIEGLNAGKLLKLDARMR